MKNCSILLAIFLILSLLYCFPTLKIDKFCDPNNVQKFIQDALIVRNTTNQESYCSLRIRDRITNTGTGVGSGTGTGTVNPVATVSQVATPVFSQTPGYFNSPQPNITISTTTAGASIYYTTDGSTPTSSSTLYTTGLGHIWFIAGRTIRAIAIKSGSTDSAVVTAEYSYNVIKTGQTLCFNDTTSVGCPGPGDDGATQFGVTRSYTNNGDGTVTDNATGLLWQRCSIGQSGATCATGSATGMTFAAAVSTCNGLATAGKTWRLPTIVELETLVQYISPTIDGTAFPSTPGNLYWTSTNYWNDVNRAYHIHFADGNNNNSLKTDSGPPYVRCVSGPTQTSFVRYVNNGDGTVRDKQTGLIWQRCGIGQTNDATCSGTLTPVIWLPALSNCSSLSLAGRTWRLPSMKELQSLADRTLNTQPLINTTFFPSTANTGYHLSTTYSGGQDYLYFVNFADGHIVNGPKSTSNGVQRCVSGP